MSGQFVALAVAVQVVPEGRGRLRWPEGDAEVREDGGATLLHLRELEKEGHTLHGDLESKQSVIQFEFTRHQETFLILSFSLSFSIS